VIDRDTVQLSVTDAMGHDFDAALPATLLVGALRRARRAGAGLAEQARQAMREHGRHGYVTGQLLRISLIVEQDLRHQSSEWWGKLEEASTASEAILVAAPPQ
jgi:NAD(P)H-dependent FMN reductase